MLYNYDVDVVVYCFSVVMDSLDKIIIDCSAGLYVCIFLLVIQVYNPWSLLTLNC